ncbi:alpha/beta hydrolase [Nonomuraea sp. B12E4]|uniref:alpha/beta hydrolase n=1 Tax=Nonomuraea sp. B12E4 TaxID=3153564 RepID=UPI00325F10F7
MTAVAPAAAASTRGISWAPCPEDPTAECGTLTVPVDWNKPRGETIELAVARRQATDPTARMGALVINPGGPTARAILTPQAEQVINDPTQVFCQDYLLPIRDYRDYAQHLRRAAAIAPDMLISPLAHSITAACLGTPAPIANPQHHLRVAGTPTLLLGNALHDPATPYSWAVGTARQIGREARLLTYEGGGHGIYGRGECPTAAFDAYLTSLAVPAKDTKCPAIPPAELSTLRTPQAQPLPGPIPGLPGWTSALR